MVRFWVLALFVALLGGCGAFGQDQAIIDATRSYVEQNASVGDIGVEVQKVDGDFARALATPPDGATDPAIVFLQRTDGIWQVISLGTAFDREFYEQNNIPPSLWL